MIALNRVKTFARTISAVERLERTGTSLTSPPRDPLGDLGRGQPGPAARVTGAVRTGSGWAPASMHASCIPTVRADLRASPAECGKIRPGEDTGPGHHKKL